MLNLFSRRPAAPVLDRSYGCPRARKLRQQFEKGQFDSVEATLKKTWDDERSFLVDVIADAEDRPSRFDDWIERKTESSLARLTSGAHALEWAWQARTYGHAHDVPEERWKTFADRLAFARRELNRAIELAPDDTAPYAYLIRCGLGEQWPLKQVSIVYQSCNQLDPANFLAAFNYLTFLCEKWFGSHDLMFRFARAVSKNTEDGKDVHAMVAYAHIERWLFEVAFEENPQADDYWKADDVFDELITTYKRWCTKTEESPWEKVAANAFLFCFAFMNAREIERVELDRIGPYPSYTPWRYLGNPVAVYRDLRKIVDEAD